MDYTSISHSTQTSVDKSQALATVQPTGLTVMGMCIESLVLAGFCMADAISTIIFVSIGAATEYNPIMAFFLGYGVMAFLIAKILSFTPFIVVCEIYRRREPQRGRSMIRWATISYIALYVVTLMLVNTGQI